MSTPRFDAYARRKTEAAVAAHLEGFATVREPEETENLTAVGNVFARRLFDGPFYRSMAAPASGMPVVSAVFVQSLEGNTGAVAFFEDALHPESEA